MMNNPQPHPLPCYYNRTSLGSVLESQCCDAIDAFEGLQIRDGLALLAAAKQRVIEAASIAGEHVFRFTSPPLPQAPTVITNADGTTAEGNIAVPAEGSFVDNLNYGSSCVWTTPTCRPKQEEAVETIIFLEVCGSKLLVVDRTGSGKSHILRMTATFVGGVILVIVPLLALTADQMAKLELLCREKGLSALITSMTFHSSYYWN